MEQIINNTEIEITGSQIQEILSKESTSARAFIEANTISATMEEVREKHIIPVFIKDNEPVISQSDFIETVLTSAKEIFEAETISEPIIRVSHPIKGRVPEARDKPANELQEHEKTLYFERMGFIIEIPSISDTIDGNKLSLTIGGVKSHASDNLYNKKGADEHFKIFIGFQNKVCTNMCVWSDGIMDNVKVQNIGQLKACVKSLLESYNAGFQLYELRQLCNFSLTEQQFALLIGRCRLYQHLPATIKNDIPSLLFGENQISAVCKDYFRDDSFCKDSDGNISLWKLYNLFTGANKSSYLDSFLERSINAYNFVEQIKWELEGKSRSWYLN